MTETPEDANLTSEVVRFHLKTLGTSIIELFAYFLPQFDIRLFRTNLFFSVTEVTHEAANWTLSMSGFAWKLLALSQTRFMLDFYHLKSIFLQI